MDGITIWGQPTNSAVRIISNSDLETRSLGAQLGSILEKNSIICFFGDLGAGKTTFIKGLVSSVTEQPCEVVNSPTYTYLNIHSGPTTVYHFDLYRLSDSEDFIQMGFDEFFTAGGICCIEWSERIQDILPKSALKIKIKNLSVESREIEFLSGGDK